MGAAVLERVHRPVLVARDDDRHFAEARAAISVGAGQLRFQAQEIPGGAAEDALLLARVEFLVGIDPVGHPREALAGPLPARNCNRHATLLSVIPKSGYRFSEKIMLHESYSILIPAVLITLAQRSV